MTEGPTARLRERITVGELPSPYVAADFPPAEFNARIDKVREAMSRQGIDALMLASPENIYYLLGLNHQGYFSFTLVVLPLDGHPILVARAMEHATLRAQVPSCEHVGYDEDDDPAEVVAAVIRRCTARSATLGLERAAMFFPVGVWERIRELLGDRSWTDGSGIVEHVRAVKSAREITYIRRAAEISDSAVRAGVESAGTGRTERMVAAAIYHEMVLNGSEHPGFAPFIRSTDILHHEHVTWRDRSLRRESGLIMELSASVYRYHAPLTRMVYVGRLPAGVDQAAQAAIAGLAAIEATLRPGAMSGDVYAAWSRAVHGELGRRHDRHHCGYMVGIGFPPSWVGGSRVTGIRRDGKLELLPGMVFHVQSWMLGTQPAEYCVSDTALVTEDGCELLTMFEREPIVRL
ncbi:MAG TPA: Xaa-Pro peptidase family protein [Streptosporangiaceae bacterium]